MTRTGPDGRTSAANRSSRPRTRFCSNDRSDYGLGFVGVFLAVGSAAFAAHMVSNENRTPEFSGIEHLAIFSRPTRPSASRNITVAATMSGRGATAELDYTPVGSISGRSARTLLTDFELVDASGQGAFVRMPTGQVVYVSIGDHVGGAGRVQEIRVQRGKWIVVTDRGNISSREPLRRIGGQ